LLSCCSLGRSVAQEVEAPGHPHEYYPLVTGANWEYATRVNGEPSYDRTVRVASAETRGTETTAIVVHGEGPLGVITEVVGDGSGVKLLRPLGPSWILRYPLKPYTAWTQVRPASSNPNRQVRGSAIVLRDTSVTTPAGRFTAVEVWYHQADVRHFQVGVMWLAKGVGIVKSHTRTYDLSGNEVIWDSVSVLSSYHIPR
jgi:hypothetical protein